MRIVEDVVLSVAEQNKETQKQSNSDKSLGNSDIDVYANLPKIVKRGSMVSEVNGLESNKVDANEMQDDFKRNQQRKKNFVKNEDEDGELFESVQKLEKVKAAEDRAMIHQCFLSHFAFQELSQQEM